MRMKMLFILSLFSASLFWKIAPPAENGTEQNSGSVAAFVYCRYMFTVAGALKLFAGSSILECLELSERQCSFSSYVRC